jgi:hypothetical protein
MTASSPTSHDHNIESPLSPGEVLVKAYFLIILARWLKMASTNYEVVEKVIFHWLFKNAQMQVVPCEIPRNAG